MGDASVFDEVANASYGVQPADAMMQVKWSSQHAPSF
jgi:hypothetical protein